jgi:hypothetical protein
VEHPMASEFKVCEILWIYSHLDIVTSWEFDLEAQSCEFRLHDLPSSGPLFIATVCVAHGCTIHAADSKHNVWEFMEWQREIFVIVISSVFSCLAAN